MVAGLGLPAPLLGGYRGPEKEFTVLVLDFSEARAFAPRVLRCPEGTHSVLSQWLYQLAKGLFSKVENRAAAWFRQYSI